MPEKRRDFSTLLRRPPPPASPEATREASWRGIFTERGLVWAPHNLITPGVTAHVEAEARRLAESGAAHHVHTSAGAVVPGAARDALIAKAEAFVLQGAIPAVELRPSGLPVGLGLFASEELAAGEVVGEYTGLVCLIDDVEERGAYAYEAWPGSPLAIDACTAGNHTRFVNHARDANLDVLQCAVESAWHVLFVTRRTITAGEELFVDYGAEYWRRRRVISSPG